MPVDRFSSSKMVRVKCAPTTYVAVFAILFPISPNDKTLMLICSHFSPDWTPILFFQDNKTL